MTDFLVKRFVKDWEDTDSIPVRTAYGTLAGAVGIVCNVFLFLLKLLAGCALRSVSVTADAFNNLSDAGSSVIGFVGARMAGKPADREHPFGHGRIEYIAALIVAFLVLEVGFTFLKTSVSKILHPEELAFSWVLAAVLLLSVGVKLYLAAFNRRLGRRIDSKVMLATAADALGDVVTTSATVASLMVFRFFHINIDGPVGLLVACLVIRSGIGIARDTLEPLIGAPIDPALYSGIKEKVEGYPGILGSHDLLVHNYGPGRSMATIHAEVPSDDDLTACHALIDRIEREVEKETGVRLVIHIDPVETKDLAVLRAKGRLTRAVYSVDPRLTIHDFQMVRDGKDTTLFFDLLVPSDFSPEEESYAAHRVMDAVERINAGWRCVINIDRSFVRA